MLSGTIGHSCYTPVRKTECTGCGVVAFCLQLAGRWLTSSPCQQCSPLSILSTRLSACFGDWRCRQGQQQSLLLSLGNGGGSTPPGPGLSSCIHINVSMRPVQTLSWRGAQSHRLSTLPHKTTSLSHPNSEKVHLGLYLHHTSWQGKEADTMPLRHNKPTKQTLPVVKGDNVHACTNHHTVGYFVCKAAAVHASTGQLMRTPAHPAPLLRPTHGPLACICMQCCNSSTHPKLPTGACSAPA